MAAVRPMTPAVPFGELRSVWVQVTGTLCNLTCRHCFNASGPRAPWLAPLDGDAVRRTIAEAMGLGARELYFTGGEPFLHPEILELLGEALAVAPTTVLTNAMEREGLSPEFIETIRTGWWTCCLESLPAKERARGRF